MFTVTSYCQLCKTIKIINFLVQLARIMTRSLVLLVAFLACVESTYFSRPAVPDDVKIFPTPRASEDKDFWYAEAQDELVQSLARTENNNVAKNVIIFLGDGMSIPTITASRIYKGQRFGQSGEEYRLVWEDFPDTALIKTYSVNRQVPDSASTGTAYLCGVKTNFFTVGFVTSTRVTHATPAVTYAHSASREWECDSHVPFFASVQCPETKDIGRQLVEDYPGADFNVIMGGGYSCLTGDIVITPQDPAGCTRSDGLDLFSQWQANQEVQSRRYAAVRTLSELQAVNASDVDYIMGIFANSHIPFEYEKRDLGLDLPTLANMTEAAIRVLQNGENGFFLLVEGGRIDMAHHRGIANTALDETDAFDEAIRTALQLVDTQDTLILVTADHSHVAAFNGYPGRGQDILGLGSLMDDGLPLPTITYTNGPGYEDSFLVGDNGEVQRRDPSDDEVTAFDYVKPAGAPRNSETHGGDDVALYAIGPMSHLFQRTHEQSYIAHVMGYAACIGPNQSHCDQRR